MSFPAASQPDMFSDWKTEGKFNESEEYQGSMMGEVNVLSFHAAAQFKDFDTMGNFKEEKSNEDIGENT